MVEEFLSTGMVHAHNILGKWEALSETSVVLVENYLNGNEDKNTLNRYVSQILDLWNNLYPKVKDSDKYGEEIKNGFEGFKKFRANPKAISESDATMQEFMKMEEYISIVLEKMHITDFEVGKQ